MSFDFDAAVSAPFRMQPGLRRLAPGAAQLTPARAGSRHMREKLAVLSAFPQQALLADEGFDADPLLGALCAHAAAEHPAHLRQHGARTEAPLLGVAVEAGEVIETGRGSFGLGDEIARCLRQLAPAWRRAGLLSLAFEEDFAGVDGASGRIPWLAVTLPSHWAPEDKVGQPFTAVHAPVADNRLLLAAGDALMRTVTAAERWERFVWTVTGHPRLHAHPRRTDPALWQPARADIPALAWFRSERQTFIPFATPQGAQQGIQQAVFTIHVQLRPLAEAAAEPARAAALHAAIGSMSDAVLAYRNLTHAKAPLLDWLAGAAGAQRR